MPLRMTGFVDMYYLFCKPAPAKLKIHGLPELIRAFKTFSACEINKVLENPTPSIWQRGYYDRIIRNETELDRICAYIHANPVNYDNEESLFWYLILLSRFRSWKPYLEFIVIYQPVRTFTPYY